MNDNMMSLDDHIKRDKKLGRVRGQGAARGAPLPGRGRGGRNNQQAARAQPRMRANPNRIQKQQQPLRQQGRQQQAINQNVAMNRNQLRRQRRKERLMGDANATPKATAQFTQGAGQRRQLMQDLRQNKRQRGRRANLVANAQNQPRNAAMPPLRKRQPQAPVIAQNNRQQKMNQNVSPQKQVLNVVQGTLAQRKIKVRNIDARVVSVPDLQKLFGKCGPLINATFDTNEFGAYLGTATVIYSKASSAARAIKDYNLAQIDNRPMKVQYAMTQPALVPAANGNQPNKAKPQARPANANGIRKTNNRIAKSGQGKTLNVMGTARGGRRGRRSAQ